MPRLGRLYVPLEVSFFDDDRILAVSESAVILYLKMCVKAKSMGTDGMLTINQMGTLNDRAWIKRLSELERVELVSTNADRDKFFINAWLNHNDSADELARKRAADAERKRKRKPEVNGGTPY
jgi:hypothetical protein